MIQRVSASKLACWKECKRKYFFRYIENLRPQKTGTALRVGSAVHAGIEYLLQNIGKPWDRDKVFESMILGFTEGINLISDVVSYIPPEDMIELMKAVEAVESWFHYDPLGVLDPKPNIALIRTEGEFCVNAGYARRAIGFYDALIEINHELWLIEHKTTSRLDAKYFQNLLRDEQASMYIYAARKEGFEVQGVLYNIIQKPLLRLRKNEISEDFIKRIREWYAEENRFVPHRVLRNSNQMAEFERDLVATMADMRRAERSGNFYRSPSVCKGSFFGCEFESICLEDTPEAREGLFTERSKK